MPAMSGFISIADHGAVADGATLNTSPIQAALDAAARIGGTVYVPPGTWLCGAIELRSGTTLRLDPAAVLKGSPRLADYPQRECNLHEGEGRFFIYAGGATDVVIEGGGTIDGSGEAFWQAPAPGSPWWRTGNQRVCPMFEFRHCTRLRLENIRILNSPGWTVHPFCCDHVVLRGVTVDNHPFGPNTDGFDIDGCRDVFISDCKLRCGDDAIIIKATPKARSTERIVITNCICFSNCIGIGIGQETESGVRQVAISNCVVHNSHRLFTIGIWNGGFVEDVSVSNLVGDTINHHSIARPIQLEVKQSASIPQTRPLGIIRNVTISGLTCRTQGHCLITAQDGAWIDNLTLRTCASTWSTLKTGRCCPCSRTRARTSSPTSTWRPAASRRP
jgi:polygalacturonase